MTTEEAREEAHRAYTILQDIVSALTAVADDSLFGTEDRRILTAAAEAAGALSHLEGEQ